MEPEYKIFIVFWFILIVFLVLIFIFSYISNIQYNKECKELGFLSYESYKDFDLCLDSEGYYSIVKEECINFFDCKFKVMSKFNLDFKK
jgi:regulatory protein YycI of two-component signal transduction system YycFG